jgi:hypothetical protein
LRETLSRICRLLMEARHEELAAGPALEEDAPLALEAQGEISSEETEFDELPQDGVSEDTGDEDTRPAAD